jgi:predicted molibdopterin-dependent oxidoreductase YjgC
VSTLQFDVFSGGTLTMDHARCAQCRTKVCVQVCQTVGNGDILQLDGEGLPQLKVQLEQTVKGACIEDMGCMLACQIEGNKAIRFSLPMPEFDQTMKEIGALPVYKRTLKETPQQWR